MLARRVVFTGSGEVELEDFELENPAQGEILIETLYTVISPGTERAALLAEPNTITRAKGFPFVPGYANVGRIIEVGDAAEPYRPGQLVATMLQHASHGLLPATTGPGLLPEGYADKLGGSYSPNGPATPRHLIWPLADTLDADRQKASASFTISKVGLLGVRRARIELGESVLIMGLGAVGLSAAQYARLAGALPVLGLDPSPVRRKSAEAFGLDAVYGDGSELASAPVRRKSAEAFGLDAVYGDGSELASAPAVVIEATGTPEAIPQAFQLCARNGRVVLLGSTRGVTSEVNFYTDVHLKGLTVLGAHELTRPVHESTAGDWTTWDDAGLVLRLIAAGRLDPARLVTHTLSADQAAEAYGVVRDAPDALLVLLDWTK